MTNKQSINPKNIKKFKYVYCKIYNFLRLTHLMTQPSMLLQKLMQLVIRPKHRPCKRKELSNFLAQSQVVWKELIE